MLIAGLGAWLFERIEKDLQIDLFCLMIVDHSRRKGSTTFSVDFILDPFPTQIFKKLIWKFLDVTGTCCGASLKCCNTKRLILNIYYGQDCDCHFIARRVILLSSTFRNEHFENWSSTLLFTIKTKSYKGIVAFHLLGEISSERTSGYSISANKVKIFLLLIRFKLFKYIKSFCLTT